MIPRAVNGGSYDVERLRRDFPILDIKIHGQPLVYLDNAASAQKPQAVLDRIQHAYAGEYANVHRGLHFLSNAATEQYEGAREKLQHFLSASRSEEIVFTRGATEAINLVAQTFARDRIGAGDEIVLSIMEHHAEHRAVAFFARAQWGRHQNGRRSMTKGIFFSRNLRSF